MTEGNTARIVRELASDRFYKFMDDNNASEIKNMALKNDIGMVFMDLVMGSENNEELPYDIFPSFDDTKRTGALVVVLNCKWLLRDNADQYMGEVL